MNFVRGVKKAFWGVFAAVVSVLAWFSNAFLFVRNTLILVLDLPGKAMTAATIFIGVFYGIGCFIMGGGVLNIIGNIAAGCLILFLTYKLLNFVYMLGYALIGIALNFLNFERITNFFVELLQKAIYHYMDQFGPNDPTKKDQLLFAIPWMIHKINWLFEKLSSAISIAIYAIFIGAGIYFSYHRIFVSYGTSDYGAVDFIIGWAVIAAIAAIAVYLSYCVAQAIRMATDSVRPLDELFGVYAEFFQNTQKGTSGKSDNHSTNSGYYWNSSYEDQHKSQSQIQHHNDNPYYAILSTAQTTEELQKSYRGLAKKLHPDVCKDYSVEEATRRMAQLNNAYEDMKRRI